MGANAATKAFRVARNLERILAMELLVGSQAIEFRGISDTSPYLKNLLREYRKTVPFAEDDVLMYQLIDNSQQFVSEHEFILPD
jgi:histidine ammonia-lyase